jgi:hypothetical protein
MKKIAAGVAVAALALGLAACGEGNSSNSARKAEQDVVGRQQQHYLKAQPVPFFDFSQDRDTLTQIYKLKNEARTTYSVVTSQGTGKVLFECDSRGYPIPADQQLTNPDQVLDAKVEGAVVIPQAEPNGTFSSTNTDGTWILCIRANGQVVPIYTEQKVDTYPFPVEVGADGIARDKGGATSATISVKG